ncbi:MAG: septum formation initiator family protein [Oscillospiraceae bacterium]|nr:septum formation initiator family protein [Oscillospiraceae bacterium]
MEKTLHWLFAAFVSVLLIYSAWSFWSVHTGLREARSILAGLQGEAAALSRENQTLRDGLVQAGSEEALRRIAREQLGLVLPEDRIYIIGDEK